MNKYRGRKGAALCGALAAAMLLAGCGGTAAPAQTSDTAAPAESISEAESTADTPAQTNEKKEVTFNMPEDEFKAEMFKRSLYSLGNVSRLQNKMQKAMDGENVTVAYIGGSITEGYSAGDQLCYAKQSFNYFDKTFGTGNNVNYINAGLSGTPSMLGMMRAQRDILSQKPDVVFVEFAVNDSQDQTMKESYESLVRTVLEQDNEPAVVLIFMVMEQGYSAQPHMKEIGEFYDLPMISVKDALTPEFEAGRMEWKEYSGDYTHPNVVGHKLVADFISYMFAEAYNSEPAPEYKLREDFLLGAPYRNIRMIVPSDPEKDTISVADTGAFPVSQNKAPGFPECWKFDGSSEPMRLKMNGSSLFVIYKRDKTENRGSFDVLIDGKKIKTFSTYHKDGWGETFPDQVIKFTKVHDAEVEIRPSEGSEDKVIEILGFGAADNESSF